MAVVLQGHFAAARAQAPPTDRNTDVARRALLEWPSEEDPGATDFIEASYLGRGSRTVAVGMLGTLSCSDDAGPCIGSSFLKKIKRSNFEIDQGLTEASLRMTVGSRVYEVTWEGEGSHRYRNGRVRRPALAGMSGGGPAENEAQARALMTNGTRAGGLPGPIATGTGGKSALGDDSSGLERASLCASPTRAEKRLLALANAERKERGLVPLKMDPELLRVSRKHTSEMTSRETLYHTASDVLGQRVTKWRGLGENIGAGASAGSLHKAFMNSPIHRANILLSAYRFVGIGTRSSGGMLWVTVTFESKENPGTRIAC